MLILFTIANAIKFIVLGESCLGHLEEPLYVCYIKDESVLVHSTLLGDLIDYMSFIAELDLQSTFTIFSFRVIFCIFCYSDTFMET